MKNYSTMIMAILTAGTVCAAPQIANKPQAQIRFADEKPVKLQMGEKINVHTLPAAMREKAPARAGEEGGCNLTVTLDYDEAEFSTMMVSVYYEGGYDFDFTFFDKTLEFTDLPAGEAIVYVPFQNIGVPNQPMSYYVIKTVELYDGEYSMITLSPDMATEKISFPAVLPDGSAPILPTSETEQSEEYNYDGCNVKEVGAYTNIGCDKLGRLEVMGTNALSEPLDGVGGMNKFDILISPVDDSWHFTQSKWMVDLDNNIYFTHSAINGTGEAKANAPEFAEFKYDFAKNPIFELEPTEIIQPQGYSCQYMINGQIDTFNFSFFGPETHQYYLSAPVTADTENWTSNYAVMVMNTEYDKDIDFGGWMMPDMRTLDSPLVMFNSETQSLFFLNTGATLGSSPYWWNEEGTDPMVYPGLEAYSNETSERLYAFGATAPLSVTSMEAEGDEDDEEEGFVLSNSIAYLGLYSEVRGGDSVLTSTFINCGDTEETCSLDNLNRTLRNMGMEGQLKGELSIEFANDRNILVDDINGYNFTNITIADVEGADVNPPTVTAWQMRNTEGIVNNRFEKAEDGVLYLSAADMVPAVSEEGDQYWDCEPVELKVEAAPEGSDEYEEIEMMEVESNYLMPIFGYFYQGSLKNITAASENGWYKLHIVMTDQAGNTQEQTVYPAFKIGGEAGVHGIMNENELPVHYFNLQGIEIKNPKAGEIVIRRQGNNAAKIVVR